MKDDKKSRDDEMRAEYDFSKGVRGKHAAAFRQTQRVVLLDHDVARVFKDGREVNNALRALAQILRDHGRRAKK
jgi:hypothetical protein